MGCAPCVRAWSSQKCCCPKISYPLSCWASLALHVLPNEKTTTSAAETDARTVGTSFPSCAEISEKVQLTEVARTASKRYRVKRTGYFTHHLPALSPMDQTHL